jgi:glycosyltransferase involved in cell wall biosynthesis
MERSELIFDTLGPHAVTGFDPGSPAVAAPPLLSVAVLIPCHNESATIATVVRGFRHTLPTARLFVYDNRSTDDTALIAAQEGALVRHEPWPGKGNVVRRMFSDIEADVYVIVDGDATYDPQAVQPMIARLLGDGLDMVVGTRRNINRDAHRNGHAAGNRLFNALYRRLFGTGFTDIFSGYRVLSRRFVKSFPASSSGFEVETEMSVHASQLRMPSAEVETDYGARPVGSKSKLRTYRDAFRILASMVLLCKEVKPAAFFGTIAAAFALAGLWFGLPVILEFHQSGLVPRFPTAILATGLMILASVSTGCGLILDSVARGRLEQKRFNYLSLPRFSFER